MTTRLAGDVASAHLAMTDAHHSEVSSVTPSQARTRTTVDELMETLRKLEEEEKFAPTARGNEDRTWSRHHSSKHLMSKFVCNCKIHSFI